LFDQILVVVVIFVGGVMMRKLIIVVSMFVMVSLAQADIISDTGLDPSFEVMDGWWVGGAGYGTTVMYYGQTNLDAHTGNYSVEMGIVLGDAGGWAVAVAANADVSTDTEYTASAYVKNLLQTEGTIGFKVEWNSDPWYTTGEMFQAVPVSDDWQLVEWVFTSPSDAVTGLPVWLINDVPGITSDVLIDDVSLVPEPMTIALFGLGALALHRRRKA
jgi:hypothetical protein